MDWGTELAELLIGTIVCCLIWTYYRRRTFTVESRYLTFGPRFWAGPIDGFVLTPMTIAFSYLYSLDLLRTTQAVLFVIDGVLMSAYTITMHARYGQTFGKMLCKVRVVDFKTEGPISVKQAVMRDGIPLLCSAPSLIVGIVDIVHNGYTIEAIKANRSSNSHTVLMLIPLIWFVAELITMFRNDQRRALHDLIAGTVVIRTNGKEAEHISKFEVAPGVKAS